MTEPTIHEQIDNLLTSLHQLTNGGKLKQGYMDRIRTVSVSLRNISEVERVEFNRLLELTEVAEKKKPLLQRIKEWGYLLIG